MRYVPHLDGLRALAALTVLAFHAKVPGFAGGFLGVDIFFVLSGYLITRILVEEYGRTNEIDFWHFYSRRLWRLYPALLVLLVVYAALAPALFPDYGTHNHYQDVLLSGLYLGNYFISTDSPLPIIGHTWTLAVEMHFYLLWPFVLLYLQRLPHGHMVKVIGIIWLILTLWRWRWLAFNWNLDGWDAYYHTDTHSSGLILGAFIAVAKPVGSRIAGYLGLLVLAVSIGLFSWRLELTAMYGFTLAELGTAMVIMSTPQWLGQAGLVWLGKMSYGFYLWHYPVIRIMREYDFLWQVQLVVGFSSALILAAFSYYSIEQPLRRYYKRRLVARQLSS